MARWLLFSDLHFRHVDLNRILETSRWIAAQAERHQVGRVIICGDLLTSHATHRTSVLSACYRFISLLSDIVPRVHIILGNHDLGYRYDYHTTALDAFNIRRLTPYVSLHGTVTKLELDGRRVLLLPFREDQNELTEAVSTLGSMEGNKTVAFAHLAINKAIMQRYVVRADVDDPHPANSITHHGFLGADRFSSLARTFTGHFHSHQTLHQKQPGTNNDSLRGSVTYLGSPLQLSWADLNDEKRGIVLFDPQTLEHELLINPFAVSYVTADLEQVLDGQIHESAVRDKHVMLIGQLTHHKYVTARDKLVSLGVRSVRKWSPVCFSLTIDRSSFGGLGGWVPLSDVALQSSDKIDEMDQNATRLEASKSLPNAGSGIERLDLAAETRKFVELVDLDERLLLRRDQLVRVGQRLIQTSADALEHDAEVEIRYGELLDTSFKPANTRTTSEPASAPTHIFVAEPRRLMITNFLGVQNTITINFELNLPRGLTFIVGNNGSGKSTLVEAMTWCQFGKCIRSRVAIDEVVNDVIGKNCCVKLDFANGYTIERYRKHKSHKNRVIVSLRGEPQLQVRTQKAIDELLGTDYDKYTKTVVLSNESETGFLNLKPADRRQQIEASLGLSVLDASGQLSSKLLGSIDADIKEMTAKVAIFMEKINASENHLDNLNRRAKQFKAEAEEANASLQVVMQDYRSMRLNYPELDTRLPSDISKLQNRIHEEKHRLQQLESSLKHMREQKHLEPTTRRGWRLQQISQRLKQMSTHHHTGLGNFFRSMRTSILLFLSNILLSTFRAFGFPGSSGGPTAVPKCDQEAAISRLLQDIENSKLQLHSLIEQENKATIHAAMVQTQKACKALQTQVTTTQRNAATYEGLLETEKSALQLLRSEHDTLSMKHNALSTDRELFEFWSLALGKRTRQVSSTSLPSSIAKPAANFRDLILSKSLSELSPLLSQVLTVLYDDTRHVNMATGMLRSLLDSETADAATDTSVSGSALSSSLASNKRSGGNYNKRSSGERKRFDLALYFTQLQLERSRCTHRTHYVLVDEVLDNLDKAGQAAVLRWCDFMSEALVERIIVITHSESLVYGDHGENPSKVFVLEAEMGQKGTELSVQGSRIGRD